MNDNRQKRDPSKFPYPILCVIVFFLLGYLFDIWSIAWIVFLTIPVYYYLTSKNKKLIHAVPILCVIIFLLLGFAFDLWHVAWLIFLTIPIFNYFFNPKNIDNNAIDSKPHNDNHQVQDSVYDMDK